MSAPTPLTPTQPLGLTSREVFSTPSSRTATFRSAAQVLDEETKASEIQAASLAFAAALARGEIPDGVPPEDVVDLRTPEPTQEPPATPAAPSRPVRASAISVAEFKQASDGTFRMEIRMPQNDLQRPPLRREDQDDDHFWSQESTPRPTERVLASQAEQLLRRGMHPRPPTRGMFMRRSLSHLLAAARPPRNLGHRRLPDLRETGSQMTEGDESLRFTDSPGPGPAPMG